MEIEESENQVPVEVAVDEEGEEVGSIDTAAKLLFPKQAILKLMKEAAPEGKFSPALQLAINRCCALFMLYISDGAQDISTETGRRVVTPAELNASMIDSGFAEIAEEVRRGFPEELFQMKKRKRAN